MYILLVHEGAIAHQYEYSNQVHAREHFDNEEHAWLYEYSQGKYYLIDQK